MVNIGHWAPCKLGWNGIKILASIPWNDNCTLYNAIVLQSHCFLSPAPFFKPNDSNYQGSRIIRCSPQTQTDIDWDGLTPADWPVVHVHRVFWPYAIHRGSQPCIGSSDRASNPGSAENRLKSRKARQFFPPAVLSSDTYLALGSLFWNKLCFMKCDGGEQQQQRAHANSAQPSLPYRRHSLPYTRSQCSSIQWPSVEPTVWTTWTKRSGTQQVGASLILVQ